MYFSFPIDIDFAMLQAFPDAYMRIPAGGRGPGKGGKALAERRASTLKSGGQVALYEDSDTYDEAFRWYPYLFMGASKPEAHLSALGLLEDEVLKDKAPKELIALVEALAERLP